MSQRWTTQLRPWDPIFEGDINYGARNQVVGNTPPGPPPGCNPAALAQVDTLADPAFSTGGVVTVLGSHAYSTHYDAGGRLRSIDVSDPTSMSFVGTVLEPLLFDAMNAAASGSHVYVVSNADALVSVDVSNPAAMAIADTLVDASALTSATGVAISGSHAFVCAAGELTSVSISNPAAMAVVDTVAHADMNGAQDVVIVGSHAYVAGSASGKVVVVDISNPAALAVVGTALSVGGAPLAMAVLGSAHLLVTTVSDLLVSVSLAAPTAPAVADTLSDVSFDGLFGIETQGDHAVLTSRSADTVVLVDASDPTTLAVVDTLSTVDLASPYGLAIYDCHAIVACQGAGAITSVSLS